MNERDRTINSIINDDSIETPDISRTERLLEEEIVRDDPDFELIDELTRLLMELKDIAPQDADFENGLAKIERKAVKNHKRRSIKRILGIAASFVLVCALLYKPLNASGLIDRFPALKFVDGHLVVDLKNSADPDKKAGKKTDPDDPYSIKNVASVYGMDVYTPTYMPEGKFTYHNKCEKSDGKIRCCFTFFYNEEGKAPYLCKNIDVIYESAKPDELDIFEYNSGDDSSRNRINPMEKTVVCGIDAYIFSFHEPDTKNDIYTMRFYYKTSEDNGVLTTVMCQNLTKEEAYAVYNSFK